MFSEQNDQFDWFERFFDMVSSALLSLCDCHCGSAEALSELVGCFLAYPIN
jgi:hypothetical protein